MPSRSAAAAGDLAPTAASFAPGGSLHGAAGVTAADAAPARPPTAHRPAPSLDAVGSTDSAIVPLPPALFAGSALMAFAGWRVRRANRRGRMF